jgi:hypothetical protein
MSYRRALARNGLTWQPDPGQVHPYLPEGFAAPTSLWLLVGDLRRMERDYLDPEYPVAPWAIRPGGSDPTAQLARMTGVDEDSVRKVLRALFLEQD